MVVNHKMNMMEQLLEIVLQETAGKLEDVAGIELYENLDAMIKEYEKNGVGDAKDHIYQGNMNFEDMEKLNEPFIVYDYSVTEFQFLTYTKYLEQGMRKFVDDITAP